MQQITKEMVEAIRAPRRYWKDNTLVSVIHNEATGLFSLSVYLHDNLIARYVNTDNTLCISTAGWPTMTTRERLNGVLHAFGLPHYTRRICHNLWLFDENENREVMKGNNFYDIPIDRDKCPVNLPPLVKP